MLRYDPVIIRNKEVSLLCVIQSQVARYIFIALQKSYDQSTQQINSLRHSYKTHWAAKSYHAEKKYKEQPTFQ